MSRAQHYSGCLSCFNDKYGILSFTFEQNDLASRDGWGSGLHRE
jgi:hypothetical protein